MPGAAAAGVAEGVVTGVCVDRFLPQAAQKASLVAAGVPQAGHEPMVLGEGGAALARESSTTVVPHEVQKASSARTAAPQALQ